MSAVWQVPQLTPNMVLQQLLRRYLEQKFGSELADVQAAMEALAKAYSPDQLTVQAYGLYEQFRPDIPEGKKGWGAAGQLDLDHIRLLGEEK